MRGSPRRGRTANGKTGAQIQSSRSGGAGGAGTRLEGPFRTEDQIKGEHGRDVKLKQSWAQDPKAPLAVYGVTKYATEEGWIEGQKVFRYDAVFRTRMALMDLG